MEDVHDTTMIIYIVEYTFMLKVSFLFKKNECYFDENSERIFEKIMVENIFNYLKLTSSILMIWRKLIL